MRLTRIYTLTILLVLLATAGQGQVLFGEAHGTYVELAWAPKQWPKGLKGWDLMRRKGNGPWQQLNSDLIVPELTANKPLAPVFHGSDQLAALEQKRNRLFAEGTLQEARNEAFSNSMAGADYRFAMALRSALDHDMALMMGLGFVDAQFDGDGRYEYGLFEVFEQRATKPVATYTWRYGLADALRVPMQGSVKKFKKKGLQVKYTFNAKDYQAVQPFGVNLYRQKKGSTPVKLNQQTIIVSNEGKTLGFTYLYKAANGESVYTYTR